MAKKKYVVKATDDLLTLSKKFWASPSSILSANGLQTLTPGQEIVVNSGAGFKVAQSGYRPNPRAVEARAQARANAALPVNTYSPVGDGNRRGRGESPLLQPQGFWQSVGGVLTGNVTPGNIFYKPAVEQLAVSNRSGYSTEGIGGVSVVNNTTRLTGRPMGTFASGDVMGGGIYSRPVLTGGLPPDERGIQNVPIGTSLSPDAGGGFTPTTPATRAVSQTTPTPTVSRAEAKAQFLSGNGLNPNSSYIPTRSDVWNMKANARRRSMDKSFGDDGNTDPGGAIDPNAQVVQAVVPTLENQGNFVSSAISWRV